MALPGPHRIYPKLGITGRAQLAGALDARRPGPG
jgi:hypothetical protein